MPANNVDTYDNETQFCFEIKGIAFQPNLDKFVDKKKHENDLSMIIQAKIEKGLDLILEDEDKNKNEYEYVVIPAADGNIQTIKKKKQKGLGRT